MSRIKFVLLCVLYNKKCDNSETIKSFNRSNCFPSMNVINVELHVWDNSDDDNIRSYNQNFCDENNVLHHSSGNNEKLSFIYNKFVRDYTDDILLVFDEFIDIIFKRFRKLP